MDLLDYLGMSAVLDRVDTVLGMIRIALQA
jgi:hypothetical protein